MTKPITPMCLTHGPKMEYNPDCSGCQAASDELRMVGETLMEYFCAHADELINLSPKTPWSKGE